MMNHDLSISFYNISQDIPRTNVRKIKRSSLIIPVTADTIRAEKTLLHSHMAFDHAGNITAEYRLLLRALTLSWMSEPVHKCRGSGPVNEYRGSEPVHECRGYCPILLNFPKRRINACFVVYLLYMLLKGEMEQVGGIRGKFKSCFDRFGRSVCAACYFRRHKRVFKGYGQKVRHRTPRKHGTHPGTRIFNISCQENTY